MPHMIEFTNSVKLSLSSLSGSCVVPQRLYAQTHGIMGGEGGPFKDSTGRELEWEFGRCQPELQNGCIKGEGLGDWRSEFRAFSVICLSHFN